MIRKWGEHGVEYWDIERDIFITAAHTPGILNVEEDQESSKSELRTEWKLHESIFGYIEKYLDFYPSDDLLHLE